MEKEDHKISVREILNVTNGKLVTGDENYLCQNFEMAKITITPVQATQVKSVIIQ